MTSAFRKCALNIPYSTYILWIRGVQLYCMYGSGTAMLRLVMPASILYVYCNCGASLAVERLTIASGQAHGWRLLSKVNLSNTRIGCIYYLNLYYMAEVFAPFIIDRTIHDLTFYCMEGR